MTVNYIKVSIYLFQIVNRAEVCGSVVFGLFRFVAQQPGKTGNVFLTVRQRLHVPQRGGRVTETQQLRFVSNQSEVDLLCHQFSDFALISRTSFCDFPAAHELICGSKLGYWQCEVTYCRFVVIELSFCFY